MNRKRVLRWSVALSVLLGALAGGGYLLQEDERDWAPAALWRGWVSGAKAARVSVGGWLGLESEADANADATAGKAGKAGRGGKGRGGFDPNRAQPVQVASVTRGEIDVVLNALGTVTALNTVAVRARVDGQLIRVGFREGQLVKAGEVLAEIDPRPYQVQLDQVRGQLARDEAQLAIARLDLERYRGLLAKESIARQQVEAQDALVRQLQGTVMTDRAQLDNAQLQLEFTRITAPLSGRLGLRQVDVGNTVRAGDATGIVVLTQTQPISVVFAIPAESLAPVLARLQARQTLQVEAWDRDARNRLASGRVASVDNQVDVSTGTVKIKAEFANQDQALFPNQFVNVRLRVETRKDALLIPLSALQRGTPGTFVYRLKDDLTVEIVKVQPGPQQGELLAVESGLQEGERVVSDGGDRLRPGARVELPAAGEAGSASESAPASKGERSGKGRRRGHGGAAGDDKKDQ
jgi:multidrug efflux system membrane fusion protein